MGRRRAKPKQRPGLGVLKQPGHPAARDASGRVHLLLAKDATGQARLELTTPLFDQPWQDRVALSTASTAYAALSDPPTGAEVVALTRHAMAATSRLADGFLARAVNGSVACAAGCDHCCYQSVGVTTAEALTIVDHLRATRGPDELQHVTTELATARERTRGLSPQARFSPEHPCPFLKAAQCSIYDVRPLSCRGMNSLSAAECESDLRDPSRRAAFVQQGRAGQAFMEPIRAFHAVSAGLQLGISELFQLDMRPLDLTAAVHELLLRGDELIVRWLAGEAALEQARGADATASAHVEHLTAAVARRERSSPS